MTTISSSKSTTNNDNSGWITIPTKKPKDKPNNYDDIPTSFAKKKEERKKAITHTAPIKSKTELKNQKKSVEINNILNKIDEGTYTQSTINNTLSKQLLQGRQAKGWTQKEFATLCNLNVAIIKDYENGTGIAKGTEINKMSSILGIVLTNKL